MNFAQQVAILSQCAEISGRRIGASTLGLDQETAQWLLKPKTSRCWRSFMQKRAWDWWRLTVVALLLGLIGGTQTAVAGPTNLIHVTTTVQGDSRPQGPGLCSLTEAIFAANTHTNQALDSSATQYTSGCETGTGNDTIVLTDDVYPMTDFNHNIQHSRYGPTATPVIFSNITIQGNGATIQLAAGSPNMRAFTVGFDQLDLSSGSISGWGNLTLQNVTIQAFTVKGGDGAVDGGGGGLGPGGAIYVDGSGSSGTSGLTVVNSTFTNNGAVGGNGGGPLLGGAAGGGGGGLAGNGGRGGTSQNNSAGGGGGGGGGSFGNGGAGDGGDPAAGGGGGGGGGGTDSSGQQPVAFAAGGAGGFCGGAGGNTGFLDALGNGGSGNDAGCPGGGGGGGGVLDPSNPNPFSSGGHGGKGNYGGGGGGSPVNAGGGDGGFGGGGGGGSDSGGRGGFGGGGGGSSSGGSQGLGGRFGGDGSQGNAGGGGGALGGAIFSDTSTVVIQNSTFFNNFVTRGSGGSGADNGADAGGAIFARNSSLTVQDVTVSGNQGTGSGAGIVVVNDGVATSLTLENTIVAGNGAQECSFQGSVTVAGSGNLIQNNYGCPGVAVSGSDPKLGPLQLNTPGNTPTMALQPLSPAIGAADATLNTTLPTDQRGVQRKQTPDIGAYETPAPSADLSIAKTVSSAAAVPGDTITYTLAVVNKGPNDANTVTVTDALPSQLTFVSCTESTGSGTCTLGGGTVTVSYSTLANGVSSTVTIKLTLNSGATDGLAVVNTASVSASSPPDPDTSDNSSSAFFTIHNRADLAVTKSVSTTSPYAPLVEAGDSLTYTVVLTDKGPYDARGVVLTDSAPASVTFTGCSSTLGTCVWSATSASLSLLSLSNGSTATLTIQAKLNFGVADQATVTNTASVTSTTNDPDPTNNSGSASFTALNNSDLYVTQSVTKLANRQLKYTVSVKNLGKYAAKQLLLTDAVPNGSKFVSITAGAWSCTAPAIGAGGVISCSLSAEAVGVTQTMTFVVKVTTPGSMVVNNTASVSEATADPNTANNTSTLGTKLGP